MRTFWVAVSSVNGGNGGRLSAIDSLIECTSWDERELVWQRLSIYCRASMRSIHYRYERAHANDEKHVAHYWPRHYGMCAHAHPIAPQPAIADPNDALNFCLD